MSIPVRTWPDLSEEVSKQPCLVEILRLRARESGGSRAYTFLADGEAVESHLTYGELDDRARAIAALLQGVGAAGERAILLYPPGLDYIAAFFGCLYAGCVAVPAYPPQSNRPSPRLQAVARDAEAKFALTTGRIMSSMSQRVVHTPGLESLRWIATDGLTLPPASEWRQVSPRADSLAFLQYTSGSTAAPKGVMITHANLIYNSALIQRCFNQSPETRSVIWLPPYHDMGLIGGIIQPLYSGYTAVLMSPASFLQKPMRWLETISRFKATTSGGPSFAYDLCIRRLPASGAPALDLNSWQVAFNGAEPVRADTMKRFAEAFAPYGFRLESFYPCYGLAEATLLVSGHKAEAAPVARKFQSAALEKGLAISESDEGDEGDKGGEGAKTLAGSGRCSPGDKTLIAHPETGTACSPDEIGEIWVAGPGVARGYWGRPEESDGVFRARLADTGDGPFLRTGDLGFFKDGELFVVGRLKDLIIVRGRNHYPQDIELTVEQSHPSLRPGCGAAFSIEAGGEERLVVVQEMDRHCKNVNLESVTDAIRRAVSKDHELQAHTVALVRTASLPKTSSGKIQRRACRELFLTGALAIMESSILDDEEAHSSGGAISREAVLACEPDRRQALVEAFLIAEAARVLKVSPARLDSQQSLTLLGLDSLMSVDLKNAIDASLGIETRIADFFEAATISQIAAEILFQVMDRSAGVVEIPVTEKAFPPPDPGKLALSAGQRALWFLHELAPDSVAYNIASAARISGEPDVDALRRVFQKLVERHASLRTVFSSSQGRPTQQILERVEVCFRYENASHLSEQEIARLLVSEAHSPFDLQTGPLLRVRLLSRSPREHVLLLAAHHIIMDLWSMGVLTKDLDRLYQAERFGSEARMAPLAMEYADYVRWQAEMLEGPRGESLWQYWRKKLEGELSPLSLPADFPRPPAQTYRGAYETLKLGEEITAEIKALGRANRTTLYMTLLAAFQVLLHRYSGENDIMVGSPSAGRSFSELSNVVGYFVNPLVMRADLSADPPFDEFLKQVRRTALEAFEHQDFPFALLAERLQPIRDASRTPIFQIMFALQEVPVPGAERLASFALGEPGARISLDSLPLELIPLEQQSVPFDLTLVAAETEGGLGLSMQYNADLFAAPSIRRMLGHIKTLLEGIVGDPESRVSRLPLLQPAEKRQLLEEWNDTALDYDSRACVHELFERQVAETPDATALIFNSEHLSYRELNRRANALGHHLRRLGVGPETLVGICAERSTEMVVGLLGILKAGGAYVPLDPSFPAERLALILDDAGLSVLVTQRHLIDRLPSRRAEVVCLAASQDISQDAREDNPESGVSAENLAYAIFTSGSTGRPKGVLIDHRNVVNFFAGMDRRVGCDGTDTLLAVTSISFDISVLELLWTLARGAKVILLSEKAILGQAATAKRRRKSAPTQFSLFYFASDESEATGDKYRLLIEGAKFADQHGFTAVWTPERHFHAFGGLYPNPSLTSAALATITDRVQLRAGSVVLPLHHPVRVAEEWALVDNLSRGRVGIAFASGWHANDFIFFPDNYEDRKELTFRGIETVQKLWRGETVRVRAGGGLNNEIEVKLFPRPVQAELPTWITAAGTADTFVRAGQMGANVLTHLLGQSVEDVGRKIKLYRDARAKHGHDPQSGQVTLMLHTLIGERREVVREKVRAPFINYLRSSVGLIANLISSLNLPLDLKTMSPRDMDDLLAFAFDRYFETSALFGTPAVCGEMIERLKELGVDEVACLIDFGVDEDSALSGLRHLQALKEINDRSARIEDHARTPQSIDHQATLLQCTPSMMRMLALSFKSLEPLKSLRALMLGGEALPPALAAQVKESLPARLINMYGPTETTIWSATYEITGLANAVPIGSPIANTRLHILDPHGQLAPVGVIGDLYIGGAGVARGYLNRPHLTAERFTPDPFASEPGARLYSTGDLARYLPDGNVEYVGRVDHQVKLSGLRIELGEIEVALAAHPSARDAAVVVREDAPGDRRLVAYVVAAGSTAPGIGELRGFLKSKLPDYMIPSAFVILDRLPLTPNGKVDRKALPAAEGLRPESGPEYVAPRNRLEQTIVKIWQRVLGLDKVGINDNFFDLGGHSLLMAQVHAQLKEALAKDLPLVKLLEHPSVGSLARFLAQEEARPPSLSLNQDRAKKQREGLRRQRATIESRYPGKV